jgi:hypothetical protein
VHPTEASRPPSVDRQVLPRGTWPTSPTPPAAAQALCREPLFEVHSSDGSTQTLSLLELQKVRPEHLRPSRAFGNSHKKRSNRVTVQSPLAAVKTVRPTAGLENWGSFDVESQREFRAVLLLEFEREAVILVPQPFGLRNLTDRYSKHPDFLALRRQPAGRPGRRVLGTRALTQWQSADACVVTVSDRRDEQKQRGLNDQGDLVEGLTLGWRQIEPLGRVLEYNLGYLAGCRRPIRELDELAPTVLEAVGTSCSLGEIFEQGLRFDDRGALFKAALRLLWLRELEGPIEDVCLGFDFEVRPASGGAER